MDDVTTLAIEELEASGIDPASLDERTSLVVTALGHSLDTLFPQLEEHPAGLRGVAAVLRAYARLGEMYAAALDAEAQPRTPSRARIEIHAETPTLRAFNAAGEQVFPLVE